MLRISLSGIRNIQDEEGCILHPYHGSADPPGVMTIYTGHVIRPGEIFNNTQAEADAVLIKDLGWVQAWLWRQCPWTTNGTTGRQHNFDALCSLVFNAGHVFGDLLAEVNTDNRPDEVRRIWMSHTRAGNNPNALVYRRAKEVALYLTPDPPEFTEAEVANVLASVWTTSRQILADDGFSAE